MNTLPLDAIHVPETAPRTAPAEGPLFDALVQSIRTLGVLQPILVRENGNGYLLVAGARRLAAARVAGLAEIPVELSPLFDDADALAAGLAENTVREALPPVDTWRALTRLRERGYTHARAAEALGLTERRARQLDLLGSMHPDMLAAFEQYGLPSCTQVARIAVAPPDIQRNALRAKDSWAGRGKVKVPLWWRVVGHCALAAIPRDRAIFDPAAAGVVFAEDLFAEPGSEEQFATTDVKGFLAAQRAALGAWINSLVAAGVTGQLVELKDSPPSIPAGCMRSDRDAEPGRPFAGKRGDHVIAGVITSGWSLGSALARVVRPAPTPRHADAEAHAPEPSPGAPARGPITAKGLALVASRKTTALRAALSLDDIPPPTVLSLLVLAFAARNLVIRGEGREAAQSAAARLLLPGGQLAPDHADIAPVAARKLLAALLAFSAPGSGSYAPGSGAAAEWIGAAINADAHLPRFDDPEFLDTANGELLRGAAAEVELKPPSSVAALRKALSGALPGWHPSAAQFGAPAPELFDDDPDNDDPDERD